MAKALRNQEITPTPGQVAGGPRLVEPTAPASASTERGTREKVAEWKQAVGETIDDLKDRSAQTLTDVRESASEAYDEVKAKAASKLEQVKAKSADVASRARVRARSMAENYPLHILAGVAGLAFIAGVLLRIWRSNRYE